ncbi:MAG: C25 family cysteine peptidase [Candidatus Cloacimonadaceae bacterium]
MSQSHFSPFLKILLITFYLNVFISLLFAVDNNNFKIIKQTNNSIELKFDLGKWALEDIVENGKSEQSIICDAKHNLFIGEDETLPVFSALVAIPDGMDAHLVTNITQNETVKVTNLTNQDKIYMAKGSNDLYPLQSIVMSEPAQFRDFRVVNLNIYPFQYNAKNSDLQVMKTAEISLRFVPSEQGSTNPYAGYYSTAFDNLYRALILNYDTLRDEMIPINQPILLIIYPSGGDATFTAKLNDLINWKRQKGYIVNSASTATTGTISTDIKNYIQAQYNNITTRPDAILLIGDPDSGLVLASNPASYGDFPYIQLNGSDEYGDAQIGRISVSTTEQFSIYVNKEIWYERDISVTSPSFLDKMLLVGDSASSGISTYYNNYYIRDISYPVNPNYTYNIMNGSYGGGMQSAFDNALMQGVGFFNYRGYIGMSGWNPANTANFNNYKPNHGVFITCSTGTFYSGTSATETYIREGTTSVPAGGITCLGMATSGTHTGINNFLSGATFGGIFNYGMRTMGEASLYARNYLQNIYGISDPTDANNFKRYYNLMGDPTAEVYVATPKTFQVSSPTSILSGTTTIEVTVNDTANNHIANAKVNAYKSGSFNFTAYTNNTGVAIITLPDTLTGTFKITVSKHDFKTFTQSINISGGGLVYNGSVIDDDNSGNSSGNGNGIINAGETIEHKIKLKNTSSSTISSINGTLSCNDPYITLLATSTSVLGYISAGNTVTTMTAFRYSVSPACPDSHLVVFYVNGTSSAGAWSITFKHYVRSADLDYVSYTVTGSDSYLAPGETANIYATVINHGTETVSSVYCILRSLSNYVVVNDSLKFFGNISSGASFSNSSAPFNLTARANAISGMTIPMELYLYNDSGYNETEAFTLTIGQITVTSPLGQDAYGYSIYDQGDTGYIDCPVYNWIGIAPAEGGSGTALLITDTNDTSDEGDQIGSDAGEVVTLPFSFKYYGVNYTTMTVCSNGFIAFGATNNYDWRNGRLPGGNGPNAMVAAFWDDLETHSGSGIFSYYNTTSHYYIVEWYNMFNGYNSNSVETFEIILYDPLYYPTSTGDGPIKIQYKTFNNVDTSSSTTNHGNYCTIGIKDHTGTIGLEYSYRNVYPTAALPFATSDSNKALYISTAPVMSSAPSLWITNQNIIDSNGNGYAEPGETIDVRLTISNLGLTTANNVQVTISETDPWINITGNTATFGNINSSSTVVNTGGLIINVLTGCSDNYIATVNALITCTGYSFNRTFTITVHTPLLGFGYFTISDPSPGNNNGVLDPGEIVILSIPLNNTGVVASPAGNATLTSPTTGITINQGTANFAAIAAGESVTLTFNLTAAASMSIGTIAYLVFNAAASSYTATSNLSVEIGAPLVMTIGNGTSSQTYPLDRYYNYCSHEAIYLASEIRTACYIKSIAYYKASGSDVSPIETVNIYMKNTTNSTLTTGNYSTDGYTQVYSGTFPNDATSGWMEVNLNSLFEYDGISNLSILIVKGYQQWISSYPYWNYSTTSTNRARQNRSDSEQPLSLTATNNLPNLRMKYFPIGNILYPPRELSAFVGNRYVNLSWSAPISGTPIAYRIFRNSSQIAQVTGLSYHDDTVVNETTYTYYVVAVYSGGVSDPSNYVTVTPSSNPLVEIVLGSGTSITGNSTPSPINIWYKSLHGQSVYTRAELNATGIYGPTNIIRVGFYVATAPIYALPNFIVRMKHTSASNVSSWQTADNMVTVYSSTSYMPTAGGYDLLTLTTPFQWNGTDNIVIDTAFSLLAQYNQSGTVQYTTVTNGYRYVQSDTVDETNVFTGGSTSTNRPNIKLVVQNIHLDAPVVTIETISGGVRLSWTPVSGANSYLIYAANDPYSTFDEIGVVTGTQFTDTAAVTHRFYNVVASNVAGTSKNEH